MTSIARTVFDNPGKLGLGLLTAVMIFCLPTLAFAAPPKIFLNGVDITGVKNQQFEDADVKIDSEGNVLINAPQYKVEVQGESGGTNTNANDSGSTNTGSVGGEYYLVVNNSNPGSVQYELDIYINGVLVRTIKDQQSQVVVEVTDKLANGTNTVKINAKKVMGTGRQSAAASDAIDLLIGKGSSAGNRLEIERQLMSFHVDASQTDDKTRTFTFKVK